MRTKFYLAFACIVLALTACTKWETPTYTLDDKKMTLSPSQYSDIQQTRNIDGKYLRRTAQEYARHGNGPVQVTVTYNPESRTNRADVANSHLSRIISGLNIEGIKDIGGDVLPVIDEDDVSKTLIYYSRLTVAGPDCSLMPGIETRHTHLDKEYELGCSVETIMARQIARPQDINGTATANGGDARRAGVIADRYRSGQPPEALTGDRFSE